MGAAAAAAAPAAVPPAGTAIPHIEPGMTASALQIAWATVVAHGGSVSDRDMRAHLERRVPRWGTGGATSVLAATSVALVNTLSITASNVLSAHQKDARIAELQSTAQMRHRCEQNALDRLADAITARDTAAADAHEARNEVAEQRASVRGLDAGIEELRTEVVSLTTDLRRECARTADLDDELDDARRDLVCVYAGNDNEDTLRRELLEARDAANIQDATMHALEARNTHMETRVAELAHKYACLRAACATADAAAAAASAAAAAEEDVDVWADASLGGSVSAPPSPAMPPTPPPPSPPPSTPVSTDEAPPEAAAPHPACCCDAAQQTDARYWREMDSADAHADAGPGARRRLPMRAAALNMKYRPHGRDFVYSRSARRATKRMRF